MIDYIPVFGQSDFVMNRLSTKDRAQIVRCLAEGSSIRTTVRITEFSKNTVAKLLLDMAVVCANYQDESFRDLKCRRLQLDETWSFCYAKQKNVPAVSSVNYYSR